MGGAGGNEMLRAQQGGQEVNVRCRYQGRDTGDEGNADDKA